MVKKNLLVLVLAIVIAGSTYAVDLSAGLGGVFIAQQDIIKLPSYLSAHTDRVRLMGGGFFAFFDATYAEAQIGVLFGNGEERMGGEWRNQSTGSILTIAVYGKYPFDMGGFSLFPMFGIHSDIGLDITNKDGGGGAPPDEYLTRFWFKFGAGADFDLTKKMYVRPSFLYGINFGNKLIRDYKQKLKDHGEDMSFYSHGLDVRLAVGYKF